jgi:hypothetical protein
LADLTTKFERTSSIWHKNVNEMDRIVVGAQNYRAKLKSGRKHDLDEFSLTDKF